MDGGRHRSKGRDKKMTALRATILVYSVGILSGLFILAVMGLIVFAQMQGGFVRATLSAMAHTTNTYKENFGVLPPSIMELEPFTTIFLFDQEEKQLPKDYWSQDYLYFRISDEKAAVISLGKNGKLDTDIEGLSDLRGGRVSETGYKNVFLLDAAGDDWVYLAGSWRTEEE